MDCRSSDIPARAVIEIARPTDPCSPLVVASPHSGRDYPADFVAGSALDPLSLRRSEDSFVDELFKAAPSLGAPLIKALFPRAYVDVNREPYELDPAMFDGPLPLHANTDSPRVEAGLGTIPRVVAHRAEIYRHKLPVAEAFRRIDTCYFPYHRALADLVGETRARFGYCLLIDCHSMPSAAHGSPARHSPFDIDIVLGDAYGTSCHPVMTATVKRILERSGLRVMRNQPYAGGYTTRHYGCPEQGVHALQIEVNRMLYMDEDTHQRRTGFCGVAGVMTGVLSALATLSARDVEP